jgi:hypothetical protein
VVVALAVVAQLAVATYVGVAPGHERRAVIIEQRKRHGTMLRKALRRSSRIQGAEIAILRREIDRVSDRFGSLLHRSGSRAAISASLRT